jgi:release factor glutamine methyltransferase
MPTYTEAFQSLRAALQPLYDAGESAAIARMFLQQTTGFSYTQGIARDTPIPPLTAGMIARGQEELVKGRPVQYVLGRAEFLGQSFLVDERVLIPRPETEELVSWIVEEWKGQQNLVITDVGTGSGCIPVSLSLEITGATVYTCDVSAPALELARQNSERLEARVRFAQLDFLQRDEWQKLKPSHVIVSNPPYILDSEVLHPNVRDHEPSVALFVPGTDPLVFYRALADFGKNYLLSGGAIYCETHSDHGEPTKAVFTDAGYSDVVLRKDLDGRDRMIRARI